MHLFFHTHFNLQERIRHLTHYMYVNQTLHVCIFHLVPILYKYYHYKCRNHTQIGYNMCISKPILVVPTGVKFSFDRLCHSNHSRSIWSFLRPLGILNTYIELCRWYIGIHFLFGPYDWKYSTTMKILICWVTNRIFDTYFNLLVKM